jgi:hypothetical protein
LNDKCAWGIYHKVFSHFIIAFSIKPPRTRKARYIRHGFDIPNNDVSFHNREAGFG